MKTFVLGCAALAALVMLIPSHAAQYPQRSVRVLVGQGAGGGTDSVGRMTAQKLGEVYGQTFVVDNRPSAGGNVAGELAARAAPDGYTLLVVTPTHVVNPSLYRDLRYDAISDFAPIALIVFAQYYLSVGNTLPVANVKELLGYVKSRPQPLSFASSDIGSANHLSGELFNTMAGIKLVHVPYKGGAPALNALIANEVAVSFTSGAAIPHAKAGRIRTIAVTGPKRSSIAPQIPTIGESGLPGYEVIGWYGLVAPAKTPRPIVDSLNATINKSLPEMRERFEAIGMEVSGGQSAEFGAFLKAERDKWAKVVKMSGAKVE